VLGIVVAGGVLVLLPGLRGTAVADGTFVLFGMLAGVGVERCLHLLFGWNLDPKRSFLQRKRDTDLRLAELQQRQAEGWVTPEEVHHIANRLVRNEALGLPRLRGPRGRYRKHQPPASAPPASPRSEKPAA
jgi:hypothetical protein